MNVWQMQPRAPLVRVGRFELKPTVSRSNVRGTRRHGAEK
jgi:hypothetical protein